MATSMAENRMAQECAVCVERYRDPRILECAHHFCKVCLEEIAERHQQGYTTCPICRHVTKTDGVKAIAALPKYCMLNYFIEEVRVFKSDSETKKTSKQCDICSDLLATNSCPQCQMNYCEKCILDHKHLEQVNDHKVYPISRYMFCEQHDAHAVCICTDCGVVCCLKCSMTTHKQHEISDILKMTTGVKERLLEHKRRLESESQGRTIYTNVTQVLQQAHSVQSDTRKEADALIKSLKQLIRKVENLKSEADEKLSSTIKTLTLYATDMQNLLDSKSSLITIIDALSQKASSFEMVARESSLPKYHAETMSELLATPVVEIPNINISLREFAEKMETFSKGLVLTTTKHEVHRKTGEPISNPEKTASFNAGDNLYGIAVDEKQITVVVRRKNANSPITVYDYNGVNLKSFGSGVPGIYGKEYQGITIDTRRNLYVLPVTDGKVVTLSKDGSVVSTINVINGGQVAHGICYSEQDMYLTCNYKTNSVYLIDAESLIVIKTIQNLSYPRGVTCDIYQGTPAIMVCGYYGHTVKVIDYDGNELQTFGTGVAGSGVNQLHNPWGVTTDPAGRLLVCDGSNYRVMSINDDSSEVLLDKSQLGFKPLYIATNKMKRMLVIGNENGSVAYFRF